jgi:enoyl-CoA hydratase/carnithine racemase
MGCQDSMQRTYESADGQIAIAFMNGLALAGGSELGLSCNIVISDDDAKPGEKHLRKNLFPGGGSSQPLTRKLALPLAMSHLLTGRRVCGRNAERMMLVSVAVTSRVLQSRTMQLAEVIAKSDPDALAAIKCDARRSLELLLKEGHLDKRWMQYRYRHAPPFSAGIYPQTG